MVNVLSLLLAVLGGLCNVLARLALAYPDHQTKNHGKEYSRCFLRWALLINIVLQLLSAGANVSAGFFGPVSIVLPTIVSSQLVFNMLFFGGLRLEDFEKTKRVGTFVVMLAAISLQVVGPTVQEDQDILHLLAQPYAIAWSSVLGVIMVVAVFEVWWQSRRVQTAQKHGLFLWLLLSQAAATVISTTAAKMFVLVQGGALGASFLVWGFSGLILVYATIVQSTEVNQSQFVPVLVTVDILVNALTGIIIWDDWRVVVNWTGYLCVFFQLAFGNYLLTSVDILDIYQERRRGRNPSHRHPSLTPKELPPSSSGTFFSGKDETASGSNDADDGVPVLPVAITADEEPVPDLEQPQQQQSTESVLRASGLSV